MKLIIITYQSYKREAIEYSLEALDFIIHNHEWIVELEIVDLISFSSEIIIERPSNV